MVRRLPLPPSSSPLFFLLLFSSLAACGPETVNSLVDLGESQCSFCPSPSAPDENTNQPADEEHPTAYDPGALPQAEESPQDAIVQLLNSLVIVEPSQDIPAYDRSSWGNWKDEDSDCQNARDETLIAEATGEITFRDQTTQCKVATGQWQTPFSAQLVTISGELDIDHMVPLKNAHLSGAWAWPIDTRRAYFNDLSFPNHLIAVTASANRSKGARGPENWKPENQAYWCQYATDWITIKLDWGLSANQAEWLALEEMIETCTEE